MKVARFSHFTALVIAGASAAVAFLPSVSRANESQAAVLALLFRPGARELALGGAGVAGARGSSASYYNPELLSWQAIDEGQRYPRAVGTTYYKILQNFGLNDMYYMYFPTMFSVKDWGQFSVNVTYLNLGEQQRTSEGGENLGTFNTYTLAVGLSYASKIGAHTSAGITAKWFYDHLADAGTGFEKGDPTGTGFAVDAGIAYRPSDRLYFGAALRNYGPNVQYIDAKQASPTPVNFTVGTSWKAFDTQYNDVTIMADLYKPLVQDYRKSWYLSILRSWADESVYKVEEIPDGQGGVTRIEHRNTLREETRQVDVLTGVEYTYADYVAIRGGYFRDWDGQRNWMTFGGGLRLPIASTALLVDFAYVHSLSGKGSDPNDGQQVYSIGFTF